MAKRRKFCILSLDGGGIRELIAAVWLARLENKLGKPLRRCFDLVAGTSTGSILGCGVAAGIPAGRIVDLYLERGREIFPATAERLWSRARRTFLEGLSAPKYDGKGLARVLQSVFESRTLGSLKIKHLLVTTYNTLTREAVVFKNTKHKNLLVWNVCKASCSAPIYFPAHVMRLGRRRSPMIDGGVVANNPTACAIAEAVRINRDRDGIGMEDFLVASFGTGQTTRSISIDAAQEWGALEWALPLFDVLFDGATDAVDYIARQLVPKDRYFRFQTPLEDAYDDVDNADRTNLNALLNVADNYLSASGGDDKIDSLVELLA